MNKKITFIIVFSCSTLSLFAGGDKIPELLAKNNELSTVTHPLKDQHSSQLEDPLAIACLLRDQHYSQLEDSLDLKKLTTKIAVDLARGKLTPGKEASRLLTHIGGAHAPTVRERPSEKNTFQNTFLREAIFASTVSTPSISSTTAILSITPEKINSLPILPQHFTSKEITPLSLPKINYQGVSMLNMYHSPTDTNIFQNPQK